MNFALVLAAVILAVLIQSIGFGTVYVFRGAREGERRDTKIVNNDIDTLKTAITRLKNNFNVSDDLTFESIGFTVYYP